jgi:hypothetical protein
MSVGNKTQRMCSLATAPAPVKPQCPLCSLPAGKNRLREAANCALEMAQNCIAPASLEEDGSAGAK